MKNNNDGHVDSETEILSKMQDIVINTGKLLLKYFKDHKYGNVSIKDDNSPVTKADFAAQNYILQELNKHYPLFGIVSEEQSKDKNKNEISESYFVVDPLDSTKNFIRGIPFFDVSVALIINGHVTIGVVYDPIHDQIYSAIKGKGAWCNGTPVKIITQRELAGADIDINCTKLPVEQYNAINEFIARKCKKVRYFGNAVLETCWITSGRLDAVINHYLSIWDIAACGLILEEAGGIWSSFDSSKPSMKNLEKFPIVASSNKVLHKEILDAIQGE